MVALAIKDQSGRSVTYGSVVNGDFDREWVVLVRELCDPVFAATGVTFYFQVQSSDTGPALLWEAGPDEFASRYPDSDIAEDLAAGLEPPPCVDYWVYVRAAQRRAEFSVEGWPEWGWEIELSGDARRDGIAISREFARILRVDS